MSKYFSPTKLGFFDDDLKKSYDSAGSWPDDAVEITDAVWQTFLGAPPDGKYLGVGTLGGPLWIDKPDPTTDELITGAKEKQSNLISSAKSTISIWQSELLLGSISDVDRASLIAWLAYIKAVEAIDTSKVPDIIWPELPKL